MDIHPPHGPARSIKEFLLQLLTVTVGILIALSLEGMLEWRHHEHLVHGAEANLAMEIRENRASLERGLQQMDKIQAQLANILNAVHTLQADRNAKLKPEDLGLEVSITTLQSSGWSATSVTGAIGYMRYDAVEQYTAIYDLQQEYMTAQQKSVDSLVVLESYGVLLRGDLRKVSDAQAVEAARVVGQAMASTKMTQDIGRALDAEYGRFLEDKK
jgi:hypothetical protein